MHLQMRGITKRFGATAALTGVDLDVAPGQVHALVGENGAGKSTLMKILAGAIQPDTGKMELFGKSYRPRNPADGRKAGVAMIYQELSLAPHLSVAENILLGIEPGFGPLVNRRELLRRAEDALRQIGAADIRGDEIVGRLPIARRQLVEIARSVALGCRVLVLDEPTSSLPQSDVRALFELIRRLKTKGHSVLYISHFLEEVCEISDRFSVLRDGRSIGGGATAETGVDAIVSMMVGRAVDELYPRSPRTPGEELLRFDGLIGATPPAGASLALYRGEVFGIAGLIGAGRSELLRAIFGLAPIRRGKLQIGAFVGAHSPARRWAQGVGLASEDRKSEGLALHLSIADNLTLPRLRGLGPLGLVTHARQARAVAPWINRLPIKCASPFQQTAALSGGNQQKVALARLLHADCDILLLDEPTRGIDVGSKAEIYRLIDELVSGSATEPQAQARGYFSGWGGHSARRRAERPPHPSHALAPGAQIENLPNSATAVPTKSRPRAVLIVSSYLPELLGICDRIAVMRRGRLGPARPVEEWTEQRIMAEATGAESAA